MERHRKAISDRLIAAEREVAKFRFMREVFTLGQKVLKQRRGQFAEAKDTGALIEGLDEALKNLEGLDTQAQNGLAHHEGAYKALKSLESDLSQDQGEAPNSQKEDVQGLSAAISTNASEDDAGILDVLGKQTSGCTKEPITARKRKKTTKKGSSDLKTES